MKIGFKLLALVAVLVVSVPARAQTKDPASIDTRPGPPAFTPLARDFCDSPNLPIPVQAPSGTRTTFHVESDETISGLTVTIQTTHTWVGDLIFAVTHEDSGTSATVYDRPGVPESTFGCDGADIDVDLNDAFSPSVEEVCADAVPTIGGEFSPFPDALGVFDDESMGGDWTMWVSDNAGADSGTLNTWCVTNSGLGGRPGIPATSPWGVVATVALIMGVSLFLLRKRSRASG